jgi:hypothetical protein
MMLARRSVIALLLLVRWWLRYNQSGLLAIAKYTKQKRGY